MRIILFCLVALFGQVSHAADLSLDRQTFEEQLDEFTADDAIDRYRLDRLTNDEIDVVLWYTPGTHFSQDEVAAHTDGICFGVLRQAVQLGARPFLVPMTITCQARQADSELPQAPGRLLGQSRYDAQNDTFVYSAATGR